MSQRRSVGDIVYLAPGSGFIIASNVFRVKLLGEPVDQIGLPYSICMEDCGDQACREWYNVEIVEGEYKGQQLPHVSECQMFDQFQQFQSQGETKAC